MEEKKRERREEKRRGEGKGKEVELGLKKGSVGRSGGMVGEMK